MDIAQRSSQYQFIGKCVVGIEDSTVAGGEVTTRNVSMGVLHAALGKLLEPIKRFSVRNFPVSVKRDAAFRFFSVISSYFSDIMEGMRVSRVKHLVLVQRPCIRCRAPLDDVKVLQIV